MGVLSCPDDVNKAHLNSLKCFGKPNQRTRATFVDESLTAFFLHD